MYIYRYISTNVFIWFCIYIYTHVYTYECKYIYIYTHGILFLCYTNMFGRSLVIFGQQSATRRASVSFATVRNTSCKSQRSSLVRPRRTFGTCQVMAMAVSYNVGIMIVTLTIYQLWPFISYMTFDICYIYRFVSGLWLIYVLMWV